MYYRRTFLKVTPYFGGGWGEDYQRLMIFMISKKKSSSLFYSSQRVFDFRSVLRKQSLLKDIV